MQTNKVSNEPIIDDYDTLGQTYVISSENIMLQAIRSLSLASDPDFVGAMDSETLGSRVRGLFRTAAQALGAPAKPAEGQSVDPEKIAFDGLVRNLTVSREDVASVINIAFSFKDPVKAATIVNAIVDTYMDDNIAGKVASTKVAGKVVQERVEELKRQAKDAERALLEYKMANNIVGTANTALSAEQLAALQTHLTNARVAMAEARARMERIAKDPDASALFAPDNELITRLRSELLDLSVRANDIEGRVGKGHLAAVKVRNRMEEVREGIAAEQKRVAGSFGKNYELARAQYDELSAAMSRAMGEEGANSDVKARMRELESAAETLRTLYNQALQQFSQMNRVDAQPAFTPDFRVLMRASSPAQTESSKKRWLIRPRPLSTCFDSMRMRWTYVGPSTTSTTSSTCSVANTGPSCLRTWPACWSCTARTTRWGTSPPGATRPSSGTPTIRAPPAPGCPTEPWVRSASPAETPSATRCTGTPRSSAGATRRCSSWDAASAPTRSISRDRAPSSQSRNSQTSR
jgi:succinoglycan biosynthesis transport protein ExoP